MRMRSALPAVIGARKDAFGCRRVQADRPCIEILEYMASLDYIHTFCGNTNSRLAHRRSRGNRIRRQLPLEEVKRRHLRPLAPDAARELNVLRHDGDALRVDGAQVGVLEQADEVRLGCLLEREHRGRLEAKVRLEVLRNLAHEPLEGQLPDEQLRRLLVLANLTACRISSPPHTQTHTGTPHTHSHW